MSQLSNITLPDGTNYTLKGSIYTVIGTQTEATGSWTGDLTSLDALYDGLTIAYYLPWAGSGNATLNLTLKNGTTGAKNIYFQTSTRLTTHYPKGSIVWLTYFSAGSIKIDNTATTDDRWIAHANYYKNDNTFPSFYCSTGAATAAKAGTLTTEGWNSGTVKDQTKPIYCMIDLYYNNTAASALTFTVSNWPAKPIYINGVASSTTNYTLPKGTYFVYYDGTNFNFRTDGLLPTGGINIGNKVSLVYNSTTDALDFIFN